MMASVAPHGHRSPLQPPAPATAPIPAAGRDQSGAAEPSDEALLVRIARRDLSALDMLYARYGRVAFSVAYHILSNAESAEDVVQDVFPTVWWRADSYARGRGSARTWLLSIVRHRAIGVARAVRPQGTPLDEVIGLVAPDDDPSAEA